MTRLSRRIAAVLVLALAFELIASPPRASAHTKSISYSSWVVTEYGASVRVRISLLELSRLGFAAAGGVDEERAAAYLRERLRFSADPLDCEAEFPIRVSAPEGWAHFEWWTLCGAAGDPEVEASSIERSDIERYMIESSMALEVAPGHIHFARVHADGIPTRERVLSDRGPSWVLERAAPGAGHSPPQGTSVMGYVVIGVEHILSGWDHLAFVFALLLLAGSVGEVARLVTGFTLAHSVTLALAVLGVLNPETAAIEALIGFSIARVAAENAWLLAGGGWWIPGLGVAGVLAMACLASFGVGVVSWLTLFGIAVFAACHFGLLERVRNPRPLRVAVAFAFGLIHGFGFAGVLSEMSLPADRLVSALFGFNVGVELGQLAVVTLIWPLLHVLANWKQGRTHTWVTEAGSAAVCGLGLFWFVTRSFS